MVSTSQRRSAEVNGGQHESTKSTWVKSCRVSGRRQGLIQNVLKVNESQPEQQEFRSNDAEREGEEEGKHESKRQKNLYNIAAQQNKQRRLLQAILLRSL